MNWTPTATNVAFACVKPRKGLGGWLAGFILSLVASTFIYGYALFMGLTDSDTKIASLPVLVIAFYTILAALATVLMLAKRYDGIIVSKIFVTMNAALWIVGSWFISQMIWVFVFAIAYAIVAWVYLDFSERVRNTYTS
jgi:hypothetical protein